MQFSVGKKYKFVLLLGRTKIYERYNDGLRFSPSHSDVISLDVVELECIEAVEVKQLGKRDVVRQGYRFQDCDGGIWINQLPFYYEGSELYNASVFNEYATKHPHSGIIGTISMSVLEVFIQFHPLLKEKCHERSG